MQILHELEHHGVYVDVKAGIVGWSSQVNESAVTVTLQAMIALVLSLPRRW